MPKVGDNLTFEVNGEVKHGKVVNIYTQVGYENHGKEIVVISLFDSHLRFYEGEIKITNENLKII